MEEDRVEEEVMFLPLIESTFRHAAGLPNTHKCVDGNVFVGMKEKVRQ